MRGMWGLFLHFPSSSARPTTARGWVTAPVLVPQCGRCREEWPIERFHSRRGVLRQCKYLNNVIEIVFAHMTKPNLLAVKMVGDYVTDIDFALGLKDPIN